VHFSTCRNIPTVVISANKVHFFVTIAVKWSNYFFLHRKGKALCECPFVLHRQQPEKYKQNIGVPPWKNIC